MNKPDRETSRRALRALAAATLPLDAGFAVADALRGMGMDPLPPPEADPEADWQAAAKAVYYALLYRARRAYVEAKSYGYSDYDLEGNAFAKGDRYCEALEVMRDAGYKNGYVDIGEDKDEEAYEMEGEYYGIL